MTSKRPYILLLNLFFSIITCTLTATSLTANTHTDKQTELNSLQKKIKRLQQTIATKQNSKSEFIKQLRNIEKKIGTINQKIKKSSSLISASKKQLKKLNKQKKSLNHSLSNNKKSLSNQIYGAYTQGQNSHLQMIFNQQDPAQFQRQLMFYQYLTSQQSDTIDAVTDDLQTLSRTEDNIKKEKTQLTSNKKTLETQKSSLTKDRSKRKKIVKKLNSELNRQGSKLNSLNEDAEQLKQLIASINEIFKDNSAPKTPFVKQKGKLPWPLKGNLKTMYGRLKPLSKLKWQGNIIYAPNGRHVRAISSGRVAYADWLKGFGNIIILDHGDGYLSLYGNNESLYKLPGEEVRKGEIISSAGNSGGKSKSGVYFEIRKKGRPQNPSIWCRKKNKFVS